MGAKENFNQAMQEVFKLNRGSKGTSRDSNLAEKLDNQVPEPNNPIEFKSIYESKAQQFVETSLISKDTKIIGNIMSKANLNICGDVFGDVKCDSNVNISGRVEGNISGKNIQISGAVVKGNITASGQLEIVNNSEILGNISAEDLNLNSKVNGNINIKNSAVIQRNSSVIGDITAMTVNIEKGSTIKSMVNIVGEKDFNADISPNTDPSAEE